MLCNFTLNRFCTILIKYFQIIRHLGREKVPKNTFESPQTVQLNKERKSSELDETNTMEMSIRQVVEVKKMTSNRP